MKEKRKEIREERLGVDFYARSARVVAQELLGVVLVRRFSDGSMAGGKIVETEAYCDSVEPDLACHASRNKGRPTKRTAMMFGRAGYGFVYFTYGNHWMFNVVTGETGQANGVLIRALEPIEGEEIMARNRVGRPRLEWTNGPGKLTKAFSIDKSHNGIDLCGSNSPIYLVSSKDKPPISTGPRVGMGKTPEPWFSIPWRYWVTDNVFVSKYR